MERLHEKRAEASRRTAKIGWAAVGVLAVIVGVVVMAVMKTHDPGGRIGDGKGYADVFLEDLRRLDFEDEAQLISAKDRIDKESKLWRLSRIDADVRALRSKINSSLQMIQDRALRESTTTSKPR